MNYTLFAYPKHFDSYPDGLGKDILDFIRKETIESLKEIASRIQMVNSDSKPTKQQIKECQPWTNLGVSEQSTEDWYCLLRNAQGDLGAFKKGLKYMLDSQDFVLDSLFCEYAYIINTDNNTLEFYSGFNKKARTRMGRYASKQIEKGRPNEYYGVVLNAKYPLEEIIGATDEKIATIVKLMQKKSTSFYNRQEREKKKLRETV